MARGYTLYCLRIILVLTLGSLTFGYGFSVISGTLGQPGFLTYFALDGNSSQQNAITGAINGIFCAGAIFGAIMVGWMCEARGRKQTMYATCIINIIGEALEAGSINLGMFLASRFIAGWGIGSIVVLVPLYQAELSPPGARGFLAGQHGGFAILGYAIAGWVGVGTYYSANPSFQWRFPIAMACVFPVALLACSPLVPESPRWLLSRGDRETAWQIVLRLHDDGTDDARHFARESFFQMEKQAESDAIAWADGGNRQLFTRPSYRKRMFMGFFIQYAAQSTGAQVIYVYIISLYQNLGLSGVIPLVLGAAYVTVATLGNFAGALVMDRFGRKPLLLIGLTGCMVSVALESAMIAQFAGTDNRAGLTMGVLFSFCFIWFYGSCIDVVGYVYIAEIFPTHIRPQGVAFSMVGTFLSTLIYVEAAPTALNDIKWAYYLVFVGLTLINIVVLYYWCPETKGLSLEEIAGQFGDTVVVHLTDANVEDLKAMQVQIEHEDNQAAGFASGEKAIRGPAQL